MRIGSFRKKVNASQEYFSLARSDEIAAEKLSQVECYRQACYFIIQAMEKYIRAKIFGIVNPKLGFFREENRTHSLDSAVEFLVKVINSDPVFYLKNKCFFKNRLLSCSTTNFHLNYLNGFLTVFNAAFVMDSNTVVIELFTKKNHSIV